MASQPEHVAKKARPWRRFLVVHVKEKIQTKGVWSKLAKEKKKKKNNMVSKLRIKLPFYLQTIVMCRAHDQDR